MRVAEAEAQPWSLLRLPIVEGMELMRKKMKMEQEVVLAKRAENINRLLSKVHDGFDITRETITRDGKEVIFSKTLDDMTIEQLTILVRNAKLVGRSKLTKKPHLIEAINNYLADHPNESLKSLCGEEDVNAITSVEEESQADTTIISVATCCPVQECNGQAIVSCELCGLQFCQDLHSSHSSHICQQLKTGYRFPDGVWGRESNPESGCTTANCTGGLEMIDALIIPKASNPSQQIEGYSSVEGEASSQLVLSSFSMDSTSNDEFISALAPVVKEPLGSSIVDKCRQESETNDAYTIAKASNPSHEALEVCSSIHDQASYQLGSTCLKAPTSNHDVISAPAVEQPPTSKVINSKRKMIEVLDAPEVSVAKKLRSIVSAGENTDAAARKLLNYESYDTEFLAKLSDVLNIDIKDALAVRRATREGVMKALISKLST